MIVLACFLFLSSDLLIVQSFRHSLYYNPPDGGKSSSDNDTSQLFQQHLDHFDSTNIVLWNQRYYVNTEFYEDKNHDRAFLYVGGEGPVNSGQIKIGSCHEAAKTYGGILFVLEHRFYGLSQPFSDLSTANLRYLKIEQALADVATFMQAMGREYNLTSDVKWILYGGSYSGSLAAWMRLKYPHLVRGAVSSSAPMFAKLVYPEYLQIVADDFTNYSKQCTQTIKTALEQLDSHFSGKTSEDISTIFNMCRETSVVTNTSLNQANLYERIIDGLAFVVQTSGTNITEKVICDKMADSSIKKEIDRLGEAVRLIYGNDTENCAAATYEDFIADLNNVTIDENKMMRQWWYQTCTEVGYYQISAKDNAIFQDRIPLDFFLNMCMDLYGEQYNATFIQSMIERTNTFTGGYGYRGSNVFFTHGSLDPWYPVGIYNGSNDQYTAVLIEGVAHCADLMRPSSNDPAQVVRTRTAIIKKVGDWLNDNNKINDERHCAVKDKNSGACVKPLWFMNVIMLIIFIKAIF